MRMTGLLLGVEFVVRKDVTTYTAHRLLQPMHGHIGVYERWSASNKGIYIIDKNLGLSLQTLRSTFITLSQSCVTMPSNRSSNENDVSVKRKSSRLLRIITSPNGFMSALKPNGNKQDISNRRAKDGDAPLRDNAIDMSLSVAETERAHELPAYSPMFHAVVSSTVAIKLPRGYRMRSLQQADYDTYTQLKTIGAMTRKAWDEQCYYLQSRNDTYTILVITDPSGTVVCTGTLILERKLVNGGSLVGQIKDLCVAPSQKGKNLGLRMLEQLNQLAIDAGCSKTSVMTQDVNEAFYKQRGEFSQLLHFG
jgi:glucosamine-phosphate N-acetyltransferase